MSPFCDWSACIPRSPPTNSGYLSLSFGLSGWIANQKQRISKGQGLADWSYNYHENPQKEKQR